MNERRRRKKLKKFCKLWWNSNTTPTAQETTLARPAPAESSATTSAHHTLATWVLETSKFIWSYVSYPPPYPRFNHFSSFFCLRLENPFLFLFVGGKTQNNVIICFAMVSAVCNMFSVFRTKGFVGKRWALCFHDFQSIIVLKGYENLFLELHPNPHLWLLTCGDFDQPLMSYGTFLFGIPNKNISKKSTQLKVWGVSNHV